MEERAASLFGLYRGPDAIETVCLTEAGALYCTFPAYLGWTPKGGYGHHPLLCYLDGTGEGLAGVLRAGNAGSNTAADHIAVLDLALAPADPIWCWFGPASLTMACSLLLVGDDLPSRIRTSRRKVAAIFA